MTEDRMFELARTYNGYTNGSENEEDYVYENSEHLEFDRIKNKFSQRPDLHAFILLDKILPSDHDIISCAEHDEIYLNPNLEELAAVITEEQILELVRCGVNFEREGLQMFV